MSYGEWLSKINRILRRKIDLSAQSRLQSDGAIMRIASLPYADWYAAGMTPNEAAEEARMETY